MESLSFLTIEPIMVSECRPTGTSDREGGRPIGTRGHHTLPLALTSRNSRMAVCWGITCTPPQQTNNLKHHYALQREEYPHQAMVHNSSSKRSTGDV